MLTQGMGRLKKGLVAVPVIRERVCLPGPARFSLHHVSSARLTNGHWRFVILAAALGGIGSWMVAHYETLIPYRWERFSAAHGEFSLQFPGKVTLEANQPATAGGATFHLMGTQTIDGDYYGLGYAEVEGLESKSATDILNSARDGAIKNVQGSLIDEKQVMVQGFPGREIRAHARKNSFLDARLLLVKNQLYMLIVASGGGRTRDDKNIRRFFDSFELPGS